MHALIIEDDPLIASYIRRALRELGFTTFAITPTTADAISEAKLRKPDLIAADYDLPEGDGVSAVETIWAAHQDRLPTIFITHKRKAVLSRRPDAVLVAKPYAFADIAQAVHQVLPGSGVRP